MLKEIHEQPDVVEACLATYFNRNRNLSSSSPVALGLPMDLYAGLEQIQIVACGTSWHASLVGQYLLEQLAGVHTLVRYASEFCYAPPPLTANTLVIGATQSGETADTLSALETAHKRQADHTCSVQTQFLGITNQPGSSLEKWVQHTIHTPAGVEIGVAATKTFVAQLLAFYALALDLAHYRQNLSKTRIGQILMGLQQLPTQIATILENSNQFAAIADKFATTQDCIVLGRGINYPVALEGALKLKETSYIHAEGYPAGEFMHGPVAMLDAKIPVIAIALPGQVYQKVLANVHKAKRTGATVLGIASTAAEPEVLELFDYQMPIPAVDELLSPILSIIPLQLLAYYVAANRDLDVDRPRNITKSLQV
jgi:glucosamine--fructose-6-phosphate aminotransferase (isomerizing)